MHAKGNASPVILDADRTVQVQHNLDFSAMSGQGLVGGVVQHFLDDMQRIVSARVHARPLFNRLQSLEDADGTL